MKRLNRTSAACVIQRAARCHLARNRVRKRVLSNIEAIYDESTGYCYYFHVDTQESSWQIPSKLCEKLRIDKHQVMTPRSRQTLATKLKKADEGKLKTSSNLTQSDAAHMLQGVYRVLQSRRILREKALKT